MLVLVTGVTTLEGLLASHPQNYIYLSVHTSTVIEQERAMEARTRQPVLHPVIRADIEAFPKKLLNHVETVVKLSLPSNEGTSEE